MRRAPSGLRMEKSPEALPRGPLEADLILRELREPPEA